MSSEKRREVWGKEFYTEGRKVRGIHQSWAIAAFHHFGPSDEHRGRKRKAEGIVDCGMWIESGFWISGTRVIAGQVTWVE